MNDIKAILFDVYGTLISTGNGSVEAARRILEKNNASINPVEFYAHWKKLHKRNMQSDIFMPERDVFRDDLRELYTIYNIGGDYTEDITIMLQSLYDRTAFPETRSVLEALRGKCALILASNTDTEPLMQNLAVNGLEFDSIFTSESLQCYKPCRKFYERVLEETGYSAAEVLFVGDSGEEDAAAPKRFGMKTVLIDRKMTGACFGQDYTFADLTGLLMLS